MSTIRVSTRNPDSSSRKLENKPSCELVKMWEGYVSGVHMVCYSGPDGREYRFIEGDGWYVLGDEPA